MISDIPVTFYTNYYCIPLTLYTKHYCIQLTGDLGLLGLHQLVHDAHGVLPALRLRVRRVQIVQGDVLYHLPPLVHVPLRHRHVLLRLQVELRRERVRSARALCEKVSMLVKNISWTKFKRFQHNGFYQI